uniref:Pyr_redox_2 domain-containing protein n=1 Tax=Angiostrongylus cantonensis TaxID=6313 RepID=A0A0K0D2N4_ANGCA
MKGVSIAWIIRDDSISSVFFDTAISEFFQKRLEMGRAEGEKNAGVLKRLRYSLSEPLGKGTIQNLSGCALGPDWTSSLSFDCDSQGRSVDVIYNVEVQEVIDEDEGVVLSLSNGDHVQCDFVIWATGVVPTTSVWKSSCQELRLSSDGGVLVDDSMCTSVPDVYACGDVCSVSWSIPSRFWKQMRLWTQARQMGDYCARCMMVNAKLDVDFCFELFTHTTSFFGYKSIVIVLSLNVIEDSLPISVLTSKHDIVFGQVVFLGDFKGERQLEGWYTIDRIIEGDQFVRCIMYNHRVVGAVLVGETDLEETVENLILNKADLEGLEDYFLDPRIDIEDYFD